MKKHVLKITGILLILIGSVLLILPLVSNYFLKDYTKKVFNYSNELDANTLQGNLINESAYDFNLIDYISASETLVELRKSKINYNQIIGQLVIPSLKMNLTLFNGINTANLYAGVSTMKPNQIMGQKNYAIAGHAVNSKGVLFTDLLKIKMGAIVKVTDKSEIFEYQIYAIDVVLDTAVHLITDEIAYKKGGPIISLMTCYHSYNPDKRFFAFGELINIYPYSRKSMEESTE